MLQKTGKLLRWVWVVPVLMLLSIFAGSAVGARELVAAGCEYDVCQYDPRPDVEVCTDTRGDIGKNCRIMDGACWESNCRPGHLW